MSAKVHLHEKKGADVRLVVEVDENGHVGRYEFDVPLGAQTEAKIDELVAKATERHKVKARRYADLEAVRVVRVRVGADVFRVVDTILTERGTDMELLVNVWRNERPFDSFALVRPKTEDMPTNEELLGMVRERIGAKNEESKNKRERVSALKSTVAAKYGRVGEV